MIHSYGVTQRGAYHIKNDTVCQDSHCIKIISEHYAVAAVADGLGSEKHTDIASAIAAENSAAFCAERITENSAESDILAVIKAAFRNSLDKINETARSNNHSADEYDTTLSLAVYIDGTVYYGHSGDSGIVVLNSDGTYEPITRQQRDENGCVFPLFFGEDKWDFGKKEAVASILLATDGMYETLFPYLLADEKNHNLCRSGKTADERGVTGLLGVHGQRGRKKGFRLHSKYSRRTGKRRQNGCRAA